MEIIVGKDSGFCRGVKNAIELAEACQGGCQTLGKLIHNESVLKELQDRGIFAIESLDDYNGGKLVIRSHGVGKDVYQALEQKGVDYIDATCVFVKKIHQIVQEKYLAGKSIIIIGDPTHPEVIGINGWCDYTAKIVQDETEIDDENCWDKNKDYCVVSQTTFDQEKCKKIINIIEKWSKTVEINNTICYTTISRQKQADTISKSCDIMLVIGSALSSNTRKLYEISKKNCPRTFYIQTISDAKSVCVAKKNNKLGIIAGASTPNELIEEVVTLMSESQINTEKSISFEEMFEKTAAKSMDVKAGKLYKNCTVLVANDDGITISFGGKKDGFIEKSEVEIDGVEYNPANYNCGDVISAIVVEKNTKAKTNDCINFSKKLVDKRAKEIQESEDLLKGAEFKALIETAVKGGLTSKIGPFSIFVPASQIRIGFVTDEDLAKYVGKTLRLRVIKGKKDKDESEIEIKKNKTVIASQRIILEEEKAVKEEALWSVLQEGAIVSGKVKRFAEFGAFVSVNGFDCLAHISDISYYKINNPGEVLEIGKSYDFVVLKADRESQKVSLGYKQLQKKPYEIAFEKYPVGSIIEGEVRSVFSYGAFVLIERDVDGLIPVSEIAHSFTKNASDVFKVGDKVTAQIIKFDGNKITLSVKALIPNDEPQQAKEVEISENDYQEAKEKRNQRNTKRFENASSSNSSAPRRPRAKKDDREEEVSSWTSEQSSATFGDLFKGLNLNIE
ncbi:MAG: 4-hydroxy-3-methylbut-2-enyl diphosphate reductase, partial [Clostridia bacterium]